MAFLSRASDGKILKIKPAGKRFTQSEIVSLVGPDPLRTELMSGDVVLHQRDGRGLNILASTLTKQSINGSALIVEPEEL